MTRLSNWLRSLWEYLREVSGENDYARYRMRALAQGRPTMRPAEFYLSKQEHRYACINPCC